MLLSKNRDVLARASAMADQKASIILGSEFIILTLIITGIWDPLKGVKESLGAEQPPEPPTIPIWSIAVFTFTLISIGFALVVLLPAVPKLHKVPEGTGGLLFFGAIAQQDREVFHSRMEKMIADDELIYDAIIDDLYFEARVLYFKKYRFLKYSYISLILGIFFALIFFATEHHSQVGAIVRESVIRFF